MNTNLEHLPEYKREELCQVVAIIRDEIREKELEKIILFGSHARGTWVEDAGITPNGYYYKYRSDFDILVIAVSCLYCFSENFCIFLQCIAQFTNLL